MSALLKTASNDVPMWPTTRNERYKYTNIAAAVKNFAAPFADGSWDVSGDTTLCTRVSIKDAPQWARELFDAAPVGDAQYRDMALWRAAQAATTELYVIDVPKNAQARIALSGMGSSFTCIRVAQGAQLTLIETRAEQSTAWINPVLMCVVDDNALLRHYRTQDNVEGVVYTQNTSVQIGRDASYEAFTMTMGAGFSRNQIHGFLNGTNGELRLGGINLLAGKQLSDTTITIDHAAPNCRSNQTYKTVLADKAHGVFQGKVHVHQIAQQTDGYQLSNALLLSPQAVMDTKPELEIYADDVKCSHGATTGQMDTSPLFYLRQRGLSEAQARLLLMQAFVGPALEEVRDETVQEEFAARSFAWLENTTLKA